MTALWNPAFSLALASRSFTRRQLLEAAALPFEVVDAPVNERQIEAAHLASGRPKRDVARALARAKALAASFARQDAYCVGADQILLLGDEILHKSTDVADLEEKLRQLSGREHRLVSAFAVARDGECLHVDDDVAVLKMRALTDEQIELYVEAAGEAVLSSVGGYQLEKLGAHLFEAIDGDHTTILGLPMLKLLQWLRTSGMLRL